MVIRVCRVCGRGSGAHDSGGSVDGGGGGGDE